VTHYNVEERFGEYTLVTCKLETGRTHQIRVHMKYLGYPLVGDVVYGPKGSSAVNIGMLLHSARLDFEHPITGERIYLEAPLPSDFAEFVTEARREYNKI
jgi:23S rRNA pseudouridine1911/1915/1917 synthase